MGCKEILINHIMFSVILSVSRVLHYGSVSICISSKWGL